MSNDRPTHSAPAAGAAQLSRTVAVLFGIVFLAVGVLGFVPGVTTHYGQLSGAGHDSGAELFGIFQVSVLHNVVHLAFGLVGLAVAGRPGLVPGYLVGGGLVYAVLTVYGLVVDRTSEANFVPLDTADNWLHAGLTVAMVGFGLVVGRMLHRSGD